VTLPLVIIILSIALLFSLKFCKDKMSDLELLLVALTSTYLCQNVYYKVFSSYDRLSFTETLNEKWTVKLFFAVVLPALLIWLLIAFKSSLAVISKISFSVLWLTILLGGEYLFLEAGYLISKKDDWYPVVDIILGSCIIGLSFSISKLIISLMRKEKLII
jgi:hypothetical protein